jgi:hypothetical protein
VLYSCCYKTALLTLVLYTRMHARHAGNWLRYTLCWQSVWQCAGHNTVQQGEVGLGAVNITDTAHEWLVSTSHGAAICVHTERDRAGSHYWQQDGGTQGKLSILFCTVVLLYSAVIAVEGNLHEFERHSRKCV